MVADRYRVVSLLGRGGMGEVYGADHLKLGQRIALKFLPTDRRMAVHSLRHSLAHAMLDAGAPLPVVQRALRHRSIGSTGVYVEADGRDCRQVASAGDHGSSAGGAAVSCRNSGRDGEARSTRAFNAGRTGHAGTRARRDVRRDVVRLEL